jgi:uncharacterized protein (TIGR03086 family)
VRTELDGAVELLDRALAYTRVALADVTDDALCHPTPCSEWTLGDLLAHMEDALDAFIEAAWGVVDVGSTSPSGSRVADLQRKACTLLGAWSRATPGDVRIGGRELASRLLVATAALEVTVHGWDVGQATGHGARIPEGLARDLLGVAGLVVAPADRGVRFGAPGAVDPAAAYDVRLLAFLGRDPSGPSGQ